MAKITLNRGVRRNDTRIQQLDPASVAVSLGSFRVANPTIVRPGVSKTGQQLQQALTAIGRFAGTDPFGATADRVEADRAAQAAQMGDARMEAMQDAMAISRIFADDTLDKEIFQEASPLTDGTQTMEETVLGLIDDARTQGQPPEVALGVFVRDQINATIDGLPEGSREMYQQVYAERYFPTVLQAAADWYNGRVDEEQSQLRLGIASGLAAGDDQFGTPAALAKATREPDSAVFAMDARQADSVFVSAAGIAEQQGNYTRAISILERVPPSRRDSKWHQARESARDGELDAYEGNLLDTLIAGGDVSGFVSRFERPFTLVQRGPGVAREYGDVPVQNSETVTAFENALTAYTRSPDVSPAQMRITIGNLAARVSGPAKSRALAALDKIPTPESELKVLMDARKKVDLRAEGDMLTLLLDGSLTYGDGVTVNRADEKGVRTMLKAKYGQQHGDRLFVQYIELRDSDTFAQSADPNKQAVTFAGLQDRMRTVGAAEGVSAEAAREVVFSEAQTKLKTGEINLAQYNKLFSMLESERKFDAERYPGEVAEVSNSIRATFAAAAGLQFTESLEGTLGLEVQTKSADPLAVTASRRLEQRFRDEWRRWSRSNAALMQSDMQKYEEKRSAWLSQKTEEYALAAAELGLQYSQAAFAERGKTAGFGPINNYRFPSQQGPTQP
ncbi:MAG: hypothetical protein VX951_08840 [Planctomycetota bacterium]|nr:hypothetical protein [Planctomycetota bacterium]